MRPPVWGDLSTGKTVVAPATTPGPWAVQDQGVRLVIDTATGAVAHVPYTDQQAQIDARLIAAAPELLAALIEARAFIPPYLAAASRAREALEKATGATQCAA